MCAHRVHVCAPCAPVCPCILYPEVAALWGQQRRGVCRAQPALSPAESHRSVRWVQKGLPAQHFCLLTYVEGPQSRRTAPVPSLRMRIEGPKVVLADDLAPGRVNPHSFSLTHSFAHRANEYPLNSRYMLALCQALETEYGTGKHPCAGVGGRLDEARVAARAMSALARAGAPALSTEGRSGLLCRWGGRGCGKSNPQAEFS